MTDLKTPFEDIDPKKYNEVIDGLQNKAKELIICKGLLNSREMEITELQERLVLAAMIEVIE